MPKINRPLDVDFSNAVIDLLGEAFEELQKAGHAPIESPTFCSSCHLLYRIEEAFGAKLTEERTPHGVAHI